MTSFVDDWIEKTTGARDAEELSKYQTLRLNEIVRYLRERSPFYRERLRNNSSISSIAELPFTYPSDIERNSAKMLCTSQIEVSRVVTHQTSGTCGHAKRIFFADSDQQAAIDFFQHGMKEFTRKNDCVLILFPGKKNGSIGRLLAEGLRRLGAKPLAYGMVVDFEDLFHFIADSEINVIAGLPQQVLELSRLCRHKRIEMAKIHSVLLSADYAAESVVKSIEGALGCNVFEHYGMTEMCFGGGVYSQERHGYHLRHGDFLFEIVETDTGMPLPLGEYGEVVFTSLKSGAMPLIRYRTGDIARFSPELRKYPLLEKIKGRAGGDVTLASGDRLSITELDEILFKIEGVLDYNAVFADNTLTLNVRSLCFDESEILGAVERSVLGGRIDNVNVFPMSKSVIEGNTMSKRSITFCGR